MGWTATSFGGVDGDFTTPQAEGQLRVVANPIPEQPDAVVLKQTYWQYKANWAKQTLSTAGPAYGAAATYLVDETELQDMGGGVVKWDRVYATKPSNWNSNVIVSKTYQAGEYTFDASNNIIDLGIVSWTRQVSGTQAHEYYIGHSSLPSIPAAPFIQLVRLYSSQLLTDLGTGFPTTVSHGKTVYSNNFAYCFITATIEPYMGDIYVLKYIYAA